jgi:hypothetical protein
MGTPKREAPAGEAGGTLSNRANAQNTRSLPSSRRTGSYRIGPSAYPGYWDWAQRPLRHCEAVRTWRRFVASWNDDPEAALGEVIIELGLDRRRRGWSA